MLAGSIANAQDNLRKQNQLLIRLIEEFNEKYQGLKEKFATLQGELGSDDDGVSIDLSMESKKDAEN